MSSMNRISMTVISGLEIKQHLSAALGRVPGYRYNIKISLHSIFAYLLSISQQGVSAIDIIQNSAVGNSSQKTEGTKTKAAS
jgi:hypothetical protein